MKKRSLLQKHAVLAATAVAAGTFFGVAPLATAQIDVTPVIYNGEQYLFGLDETFTPDPVHIGVGADANVTMEFSKIVSGRSFRMADSAGTGTPVTASLTIDSTSWLEISTIPSADDGGERAVIGVDGDAIINIQGEDDFGIGLGGEFRPRSIYTAITPESNVVINIDGKGARWNAQGWAVDLATQGTTTVNVINGGTYSGASRVVVGGGLDTEAPVYGTAYFNVDGEGSQFLAYSSGESYLSVGHRGTGIMRVSNGGVVDGTTGVSYTFHVGRQTGGIGTLILESGGKLFTEQPFRVNQDASIRGHVIVTGEGSELNVTATSLSFIGNTGTQVGEDPPIGLLDVVEGGRAFFELVRIGNQAGATGEVLIDGPGSVLAIGNYFQLAYSGTGKLTVKNGGRVEGDLTGGSYSSISRLAGQGEAIVEGAGSVLQAARLMMGVTGSDLEPSVLPGIARIRDGGELINGGHLIVANGSLIELDDGTITTVPTIASRPDYVQVINPGSLITGTGAIASDVITQDGGAVVGTGDGIAINGTIYTGVFENVVATSVELAPAIINDDRKAAGPVTLNKVRFAPGAAVNITLNTQDNVGVLLTYDEETDFSNADLNITFVPFPPTSSWYAKLVEFTGEGAAEPNFANISLPGGWLLTDGVLHHESVTPPDESRFELWAGGFGLSGPDADPAASPAGDGFTNLDKFAFGLNPTEPAASLAQVSKDGTQLILRWNRSTDTGITYAIQANSALDEGSWTAVPDAAPSVMAEPDVTPPAGYERVEWTVDVSGEGERSFYRVVSDVDSALLP